MLTFTRHGHRGHLGFSFTSTVLKPIAETIQTAQTALPTTASTTLAPSDPSVPVDATVPSATVTPTPAPTLPGQAYMTPTVQAQIPTAPATPAPDATQPVATVSEGQAPSPPTTVFVPPATTESGGSGGSGTGQQPTDSSPIVPSSALPGYYTVPSESPSWLPWAIGGGAAAVAVTLAAIFLRR